MKGLLFCTLVGDDRSGRVRKKTFFTAPNMGTPTRRERLVRGRKRPRFGRDGRTTQSISRSLDHRSKPNWRGCALCSLIPVGVVWLSCTIPNSHELDGGVCTSCQLKLFVGGSTNQSLFKCNRGTKNSSKKATYHHARRFSASIGGTAC